MAELTPNTYERDEEGLVTIRLGNKRTVKVKELSQNGASRADAMYGATNDQERQDARTLFAIREVDGTGFAPLKKVDLDRVAERFTMSEFALLQMEIAVAFRDDDLEEQAKNLAARQGIEPL